MTIHNVPDSAGADGLPPPLADDLPACPCRPLDRAAAENELLRLELWSAEHAKQMRRRALHAPPADPELRTGDLP